MLIHRSATSLFVVVGYAALDKGLIIWHMAQLDEARRWFIYSIGSSVEGVPSDARANYDEITERIRMAIQKKRHNTINMMEWMKIIKREQVRIQMGGTLVRKAGNDAGELKLGGEYNA